MKSFPNPSVGPFNAGDIANWDLREMQANMQSDNGMAAHLQMRLAREADSRRRPVFAVPGIDPGRTTALGYNEGRSVVPSAATVSAVIIVDGAGNGLGARSALFAGNPAPPKIVDQRAPEPAATAPRRRPLSDFGLQQSQVPYTLNK